ncbi:MAG TPA: DUF58 domain-containing protein [Myxococcales bacterium LLY-WYZ-16_1]|jgi:uncharacterized protein (DUF58 family)|nr:DUF58 domain-containing protein [Myxococcales bacterium LLY-WYZ-16_1]
MDDRREILRAVRRIELAARSPVQSQLVGAYHSSFKGQGMAFSDVRPYLPGDDIRHIDWNVSARHRDQGLFVKSYVEERELTVILAVDLSASHDFGTSARDKRRVLAEVGALVAFSALTHNDRVGLLLFTDEVEGVLPARKGRRHGLRVIREIIEARVRGTRTSLATATHVLQKVQRRRAVVFLLSDFLDPNLEAAMRTIRLRHDLVAIRVFDRAERDLPDLGLVEWVDAETGQRCWMDLGDPKTRKRFAARQADWNLRLRQAFHQWGVDFVEIGTGDDLVGPLVRFFAQRSARAKRGYR